MRIFDLIEAGDEDGLRELLEARPELAGKRNEEGISPVLHALYRGQRDLVEPILDANPPLDVFDSAAVDRTRGLEALLDDERQLATAWSPDGFTALHLAAYFGAEDAAKACSSGKPTRAWSAGMPRSRSRRSKARRRAATTASCSCCWSTALGSRTSRPTSCASGTPIRRRRSRPG